MKPTIRDVAKAAGVSPATVSRVLTGSDTVNASTRKKVQDAILQLNYKYEPSVNRTQITDNKNVIIIITGDTNSTFFLQFYHALQIELRQAGYIPLIAYSEYDDILDEDYLVYAQKQRFAGAILITPVDSPRMQKLLSSCEIPIVLVNRPLRTVDLNVICLDHYRAGYMGAQQLLKNGHRKIACILCSPKSASDATKIEGIQDAFADVGLESYKPLIIYGNYTQNGVYEACVSKRKELEDCTAAFISNEQMTQGFIDLQYHWGCKIPEEISIISVAVFPISNRSLDVTTIMQNADALGQNAADQMLALLQNPEAIPQKTYFPPKLHVGNSIKTIETEN